jgi:hypothetical protein
MAIWVVFNVVLALLPLAVTPLLKLFSAGGALAFDQTLLRDGELFFFSSTLSAASIGKTFELFLRGSQSVNIYTFLGLLLTLLLSAICLGVALSIKINRVPTATSTLTDGDIKMANASVAVGFLAIILSFVSFYQGGFK